MLVTEFKAYSCSYKICFKSWHGHSFRRNAFRFCY